MKQYQKILLVIVGLYGLYLLKTVLGIDISKRYTAWDVLKLPVKPLMHQHPKGTSNHLHSLSDHPIG